MKKMGLLFLVPFVFSLLTFPALSVAAAVDETEPHQILKDAVENRRTVGIVVGIVDANGKMISSYGKTAIGGGDVDGDSVFEIGSISKVFTTTLLADMIQRDEISLDDPVSKYLPKNVTMPARGGKVITLLDLATHRSGLPRLPDNIKPADPMNPYAGYTAEMLFDFLSRCTLTRDIGQSYEYSNLGVGLLGEVLARRAGKSYEALLTERIFHPLDMNSSGIVLRPEMSARLAMGHSAGLVQVKNWDIDALAGAGAIRSTATDMLKFMAANMGLEPSPLAKSMAMARQDLKDTTIPGMRIGLAWHLMTRPDTVIVWHNGGTGGYHSFAGFDLKKGLGVVVLSNSANSIDDIGFHILDDRLPLAKPPKERKEIALEPAELDAYAGEYRLAPNFMITITKEADAQISFEKDATGRVTHLVLHQGGVDQKASKVK